VTSEAATLTVAEGPRITAQPEDVMTAAGKVAKFSVEATGDGLTYQWQYRASSSGSWANTGLPGAKTDTLSITARAEYSGRQFRCVIKDKNGSSVTSEAATLTVAEGPKITAQPEDVTIAPNKLATFKVTATGDELSYQWQYRASSSANWANTNVSGAKTATLSITARAEYSGRQFRCVITDKDGGSTTSEAATLTLTE
jgi:3-methyladenine DNA glycosylase/8-oxoguanine DNA glycosylase